jgi:hypothetical protein
VQFNKETLANLLNDVQQQFPSICTRSSFHATNIISGQAVSSAAAKLNRWKQCSP